MRRRTATVLCATLACVSFTGAVRGQSHVVVRGPEARVRAIGARSAPPRPAGVPRSRVSAVERVDRALAAARRFSAALDEGAALGVLSEAEAIASAHADVPGMAGWLSEVEFAIAIVSASRDRRSWRQMSEERLRWGTTLDPDRVLRAGEAPPAIVARAAALARESATGPRGSIQLATSAPDAVAFLDDRELGPLPLTTEAPAGRHIIRVEAPGYRPWGRVFDLFEADTADFSVRLAPTPAAVERAHFARSDDPRAAATVLTEGESLLWIELARETDRALIVRCTSRGCSSASRVEFDERPSDPQTEGVFRESDWRDSTEWLSELPPIAEPPPRAWYQRWSVWVAVLTAAGVAAAASATAATRQREPGIRVIIDSSMP